MYHFDYLFCIVSMFCILWTRMSPPDRFSLIAFISYFELRGEKLAQHLFLKNIVAAVIEKWLL